MSRHFISALRTLMPFGEPAGVEAIPSDPIAKPKDSGPIRMDMRASTRTIHSDPPIIVYSYAQPRDNMHH